MHSGLIRFWLIAIAFGTVAGCAPFMPRSEYGQPLSTQTTTATELRSLPDLPEDCPIKARGSYQRLEKLLQGQNLDGGDRLLQTFEGEARRLLGRPQYYRPSDSGTTYEWPSPDCKGWYISASMGPRGSSILTAEIPPPIGVLADADSRSPLQYTLAGHRREVEAIAFSPDGQALFSGSPDGGVHRWQVSSGQHQQALDADDWIRELRVDPKGQQLMGLGKDLTVWSLADGAIAKTWEFSQGGSTRNFFSHDQRFIVSEINDELVDLWDISRQQRTATFPPPLPLPPGAGQPQSVQVAPNMTLSTSSTPVRQSSRPGYRLGAIALHPNNRTLADAQNQGLGPDQNGIILWDIPTNRKLRTLAGHSYVVEAIAFSPNGQILATGSADTSFAEESVIKLWNPDKGILIRTLSGQKGGIRAIAFSPDGQTLASGSGAGSIVLWNLRTGQALQTLTGHTRAITAIAFSPDGQTLASGSSDRTLRVWQLQGLR
ncbi:WD40 repeat domain-containing protein [Geitlerinema sp. PCC 7407]|uniref:WD40 repeat domain-containing protein n=1 Tax=Geitlerinema sp. PCC 7407 TaxID=1173025 RepID=UPI00029F919D|nr:WD40 repeat domain-containing protein [Geitlerinema sp. PCC 7407]AFY66161.1 WD40 repeat, subgroup [Geitlerinema sp. PCC 7407]